MDLESIIDQDAHIARKKGTNPGWVLAGKHSKVHVMLVFPQPIAL